MNKFPLFYNVYKSRLLQTRQTCLHEDKDSFNTISYTDALLRLCSRRLLKNIVEKGEFAHDEQFLLHQYIYIFLLFSINILSYIQIRIYLPIYLPRYFKTLAPGQSSNTIFFGVGSLPIAVSTKQRMRNCARKIVHHGFDKTAFKRLGSPP